jgi:replicative DNA helicase
MVPPQQYKDTRHEVTKIYEELRIIAGTYKIPVWTASQSNRGSLSKRLVKMEDIAEAFTKAAIADLIIGLCQTEDEKDEKIMRLFVAKSRMSSTNPIVTVIADPDRMIVKGYKDDREDIGDRIHNIKQKKSL